MKLNYLPAPLNEGCVPSSSLLFSQGKKMEVCEKANEHKFPYFDIVSADRSSGFLTFVSPEKNPTQVKFT